MSFTTCTSEFSKADLVIMPVQGDSGRLAGTE
jgi:hypothetical protein